MALASIGGRRNIHAQSCDRRKQVCLAAPGMLRQIQVPGRKIELVPECRFIRAPVVLRSDALEQLQRMHELTVAKAIFVFFFPFEGRAQTCRQVVPGCREKAQGLACFVGPAAHATSRERSQDSRASARNSVRIARLGCSSPNMAEVTVSSPGERIPRLSMHKWRQRSTTPTALGCRWVIKALAI